MPTNRSGTSASSRRRLRGSTLANATSARRLVRAILGRRSVAIAGALIVSAALGVLLTACGHHPMSAVRRVKLADDDELRRLAVIGLTMPVVDVDLPATLAALMPVSAPDSDLLTELVSAWPELTPDRRWRLVELVRDLRAASRAVATAHTDH
jgi:hypothetical protein